MVVTETRHEDANQQLHACGIRPQLQVVLDPGGGEASGESTVDEGYIGEDLVDIFKLNLVEQARNG